MSKPYQRHANLLFHVFSYPRPMPQPAQAGQLSSPQRLPLCMQEILQFLHSVFAQLARPHYLLQVSLLITSKLCVLGLILFFDGSSLPSLSRFNDVHQHSIRLFLERSRLFFQYLAPVVDVLPTTFIDLAVFGNSFVFWFLWELFLEGEGL